MGCTNVYTKGFWKVYREFEASLALKSGKIDTVEELRPSSGGLCQNFSLFQFKRVALTRTTIIIYS